MPSPASHEPTAALRIAGPDPDDAIREYVPGVCNIGPWETRRRLASGIAGLAIAGVLLEVLIVIGAPAIARAVVVLPGTGGTFSVLQARRRFCGGYALRRIANFGDTHDGIRDVTDDAAHRADMAALARLTRDSFVIGLALTVVAILLPL